MDFQGTITADISADDNCKLHECSPFESIDKFTKVADEAFKESFSITELCSGRVVYI